MKVQNFTSPRSGRPVANQFEITHDGVVYFQSYDTIIAKIENGNVTLDINADDYSRTTSKYLNQFLGNNKAERKKLLQSGTYAVQYLN